MRRWLAGQLAPPSQQREPSVPFYPPANYRAPLSEALSVSTSQAAPQTPTTFQAFYGLISGGLLVSGSRISGMPAVLVTQPVNLPAIERGLGFMARSCAIDNYTNQYLYVPAVGVFVPRYRIGVVLPLPGTQVGKVLFRDPPGITSPTAIASQIVNVTFSEADSPANGGTAFDGP